MTNQTTSHILMIRPVNFAFNAETAVNNAFQVENKDSGVQEKASKEFDDFVTVLQQNGVDVTVINDTPQPYTPDSIFPNNWVSFHSDGRVVLYPMFAPNRRQERKPAVLEKIAERFTIDKTIDLTSSEAENAFLEGTGSLVLDRQNRLAYACICERTDYLVLTDFCEQMDYTPLLFDAVDENAKPIYHTNVMMCVADKYVVICLDAVPAEHERKDLIDSFKQTKKEVIEISYSQMNHFAGNMLQVNNNRGEKLLVMSSQAYASLTKEQIDKLSSYNKIVHSPLTTIETNGGGSARCMMAEVHLPLK